MVFGNPTLRGADGARPNAEANVAILLSHQATFPAL